MRTLIAIPVFNEERHLEDVLREVRQYADDVLVIDDGSTDRTPQIIARLRDELGLDVIQRDENVGYGRSMQDAFDRAAERDFDWVITIDCDEQHEPERIPDFIREIETGQYDLISGSRYMAEFDGNDLPPADRRTINFTITAMLNELFDLELTDSFCGFKAHRVSAMAKLKLDVTGYAFPMQLWPQVVAAGLRIKEIPVRLIYNDPTRHFGGMLDDAECRLKHYLQVLKQETLRVGRVSAANIVGEREKKLNCPKARARALGLAEVS